MAGLSLKYQRDHIQSLRGSAWVIVGDHELTHDCGSPEELQSAIERIKADLDLILKDARREFAATRAAQMEASANAHGT